MQVQDRAKLLINYNQELEKKCEKALLTRETTKT